MAAASIEQARAAKEKALKGLGRTLAVVGIGITRVDAGYGLKVNLREAPPRGVSLPDAIDGVPVRIEVVGRIRGR